MRAIFWVENWSSGVIEQRTPHRGDIRGLEGRGLFVNPSPYEIAASLEKHPSVLKVLIARHPLDEERARMKGDMLLGRVAENRKDDVSEALGSLQVRGEGYRRTLDRLRDGDIEFVAKCLRQEPAGGDSGSHLFDRLVAIAAAHHAGGDLATPLAGLEDEFDLDRDALARDLAAEHDAWLPAWQKMTGELCALDLDLCSLEALWRGGRQERSQGYLRDMVKPGHLRRLRALRARLPLEMERVAQAWNAEPLPRLAPLVGLLEALERIAERSAGEGASAGDVEGLIALANGAEGFGRALWELAAYLSRLPEEHGAAGSGGAVRASGAARLAPSRDERR